MKNLLTVVSILSVVGLGAQVSPAVRLDQYQKTFLPEKIFVHTDKNIYAAGERLWMSLYIVDGLSHQPVDRSQLVRVELRNYDGDVIAEQKIHNNMGFAKGQIDIAPSSSAQSRR